MSFDLFSAFHFGTHSEIVIAGINTSKDERSLLHCEKIKGKWILRSVIWINL